jgi:hypothetical protein
MLVGIVDGDVEALRGLAEAARVFVLAAGRAHHQDGVAELHRGMPHRSVRILHLHAVPLEAERFRQPRQRRADVLVVQVRCDGHVDVLPDLNLGATHVAPIVKI